jgi:hypothetical protein
VLPKHPAHCISASIQKVQLVHDVDGLSGLELLRKSLYPERSVSEFGMGLIGEDLDDRGTSLVRRAIRNLSGESRLVAGREAPVLRSEHWNAVETFAAMTSLPSRGRLDRSRSAAGFTAEKCSSKRFDEVMRTDSDVLGFAVKYSLY